MTDKKSFLSLLGNNTEVKKIKRSNISSDFYQQKKQTDKKKIEIEEYFEYSAISQFGYDIGPEDNIEFYKQGIQNSLFKKLSKGEIRPEKIIDLHGMRTAEAETYISNTIDSINNNHMACIKIIHGKGYNSISNNCNNTAPKLKNFTARYLSEHRRVLAYCSCPIKHGGTGAVYVLISNKKLQNKP